MFCTQGKNGEFFKRDHESGQGGTVRSPVHLQSHGNLCAGRRELFYRIGRSDGAGCRRRWTVDEKPGQALSGQDGDPASFSCGLRDGIYGDRGG